MYFEAYKHTLLNLLNKIKNNPNKLPFEKYIIENQKYIEKP